MCQDFLSKNFFTIQNKRKPEKLNAKRGFTLLEVVISIVFFAIISAGLVLPVSNSISLTVDNKNINASNNLARSYLQDLGSQWSSQSNFEAGELLQLTSTYTDNGKYTVDVNSEDLEINEDGLVLVRRVEIEYKDNKGNILSKIFLDYNRPGNM